MAQTDQPITTIIEKRVFATSQLHYSVYPFKVKWWDSDTLFVPIPIFEDPDESEEFSTYRAYAL